MDILSYLQPGWNLRLGTQRLVIDAPNEVAAYDLLTNAAEQLASSVANLQFKDAQIYWEGCRKPLRVVAAMAQTSTPPMKLCCLTREHTLTLLLR